MCGVLKERWDREVPVRPGEGSPGPGDARRDVPLDVSAALLLDGSGVSMF